MKKISLFLLLAFGLNNSFAEVVTLERAQQYVIDKVIPMINPVAEIGEVTPVYHNDCLVYYVFNLQPEGWALVSATDAVKPLLGYNPTDHYVLNEEMDNSAAWMRSYASDIKKAIDENDAPIKNWDKMDNGAATRAKGSRVDPLITVTWNQGSPYNKYCPSDANGRAVVGCVAVAMAQAMSAVRYPSRPVGEFSYTHSTYGSLYINYDEEEAYNWDNILTGANSKDDVARLLYHCGVSVKMDYSPGGSGTLSSYVSAAMKRNFGYPDVVTYQVRSNYSGDWEQLVIDELEEGRAVFYRGLDPIKNYGHAFNLDGYDGNSMYHVNWGWGGVNNGYFTIDGLRDKKMDMDYTSEHAVIIGIRAPRTAPTDISLTTTTVSSDTEVGAVVAALEIQSEIKDASYSYKVTGPYNPVTKRYGAIPFSIDDKGNLLTTKELEIGKEYKAIITVTNEATGESFSKEFIIKVVDASAVDTLKYSFEIKQHGNALEINSLAYGVMDVYTLQGASVCQKNLAKGANIILLDVMSGTYLVRVQIDGHTYIHKIYIK
ncbi:MAG: C10 family peptidase [Bacteroidaceae bacterium]|nr:C10 family peptidase [Bacteroidaceae bacterium]